MNNLHIIIQARLASSRLPNKILKKIKNKTIIEIMMLRLKKFKYYKNIIIAIPDTKKNNILNNFLKKKGFNVERDSETNVLMRFYNIAKKYKMKNIMRLTSDCPLIDFKICNNLIKIFFREKLDYISTGSKFADGLDCEVFNFKSLEKSYQESKSNTDKEHVTTYIKRNKTKFRFRTYESNKDNSKIRLTIDEKKDLKFLKKIVNKFQKILDGKYVDSNHIINFINKNKNIYKINSHIIRNQGLELYL